MGKGFRVVEQRNTCQGRREGVRLMETTLRESGWERERGRGTASFSLTAVLPRMNPFSAIRRNFCRLFNQQDHISWWNNAIIQSTGSCIMMEQHFCDLVRCAKKNCGIVISIDRFCQHIFRISARLSCACFPLDVTARLGDGWEDPLEEGDPNDESRILEDPSST